MSTDPYLADTPTLIQESHRQVVRARATHPDLTGALDLELLDVSLDWDERRAPRVSADLTISVPDNLADLAILDPRTGVRVEIDCGYIRPGGDEDVYTVADLGLRSIKINRPTNTIVLSCGSDEMLVIDASPAATGNVVGTSHSDAIVKLIKACISPAPKITSTITGAAVTVDPVTDRWATIGDVADRVTAQVYDDGQRDWYIKPVPTVATTPELALTVGSNGTILASDSTLDRNSWFNYVFLRYKWTNTSGVAQEVRATAYVSDGPYSITGAAGKRIYIEEREVPTSQSVANAAAAAILSRFLTRTRNYSLTCTAAYWLRPGMTVSVTLPSSPIAELQIVQRVSFSPLDGTMQLETRLPDSKVSTGSDTPNTATTTPTPTPTPDPVPPAKQKYVSIWTSNSSQTYKGDGTKNTIVPTEVIEGYFPGTSNGNQKSVVLFTAANSTGDEAGVSIGTALSGATISKVEVYLYANHWWYNDGGTARIGYYDASSIPTTLGTLSPYVTQSGWAKNSGRWVNVTSAAFIKDLLDGSARGITLGPGVGTNPEYYGKFNGATASSNKPRLRITYSK